MTDRVLFIEPNGPRTAAVAAQWSGGLRAAGHTCIRCDARHLFRPVCTSCIIDGDAPYAGEGECPSETKSARQVDASIDRARDWDLAAIRRLRRLILDFQPHVIYVMSGDADRMALAAARGLDCQIVLQRRCPLASIDRWLLAGNVAYLASSEAQRRDLQRRGLTVMSSAWIDSCGTMESDNRTASLDKRKIVQALQLPDSAKLFGIVAELVSQDNLKDAIWISDLLKVVNDDSHLLIFGDGPEWVRLERFRRRVEIEDRVHFMGQVPNVFRWLPALDGYWCAAGDDSIDYGMSEALRLGLPMVVSNTAGHRELVQSEQSGLLFPVGNRARFSRQAFRTLEEPDLAKRLGEAARARWKERFSPSVMLDRFVTAHERLASTLSAAA